jgi:lipopolysaccharide export system permease protein
VFWSILHRTILWELTRVFLLSLIGITGMLLMAGIVAEASQHGLSPMQILAAIPLLIPSTLPYTIPATTLFATCVVYGRLAHDNEILAIKAAGINILSVVGPSVILGAAMTGLTVFLYYSIIPTTHHMMRSMVLHDVEEFLYGLLKREHCISYPGMDYRMFVKSVQGRTLIDPLFIRKDPKTHADDLIARAEEAELHVDLQHGQILFHMKRCQVVSSQSTGYFEDKIWPVELPRDFEKSGPKFRAGDMTWRELIEYRDDLRKKKEENDTKIALVSSLLSTPDANASAAAHLANLRNVSRQKRDEIRNLETEMLMRPALACGCLCFVVVGCPVGIWFSKSDYLSAFITCFLPIVFLYYPLLLCGINIAKNGKFDPVLAVWAADGIMAAVALPLYRKLLKN